MDWLEISKQSNLSENFMREHQKKLDWYMLSKSQALQEDFITEMKEQVHWTFVAMRQQLSFDFVLEHIAYIDMGHLQWNPLYEENRTKEFWEDLEEKKKEVMQSYLKIVSMQKTTINEGKSIAYTGNILFLKEYALASQYPFLKVEIIVSNQYSTSSYAKFFSSDTTTKESTVVPFEELCENVKEQKILEHSILHFLQEQGEERKILRF